MCVARWVATALVESSCGDDRSRCVAQCFKGIARDADHASVGEGRRWQKGSQEWSQIAASQVQQGGSLGEEGQLIAEDMGGSRRRPVVLASSGLGCFWRVFVHIRAQVSHEIGCGGGLILVTPLNISDSGLRAR